MFEKLSTNSLNTTEGIINLYTTNETWAGNQTITGKNRYQTRIINNERKPRTTQENIANGSWKIKENTGKEFATLAIISIIGYFLIAMFSMAGIENTSANTTYYSGILFFFILPIILTIVLISRNNNFFHKTIRNFKNLPLTVEAVWNNPDLSYFSNRIIQLENHNIEMSRQWDIYEKTVHIIFEYQKNTKNNPEYKKTATEFLQIIQENYNILDNELNEIEKTYQETTNQAAQLEQKIAEQKIIDEQNNVNHSDETYAQHIRQQWGN